MGLAVFTVASLAGGLAPTSELLIAARALQGVGAAAAGPAVAVRGAERHLDEGSAAVQAGEPAAEDAVPVGVDLAQLQLRRVAAQPPAAEKQYKYEHVAQAVS